MVGKGSVFAVAMLAAFVAAPALSADYVTNSAEIVKKANWDKMEVIEIVMKEHSYAPEELKLKANQPYKFVLKNKGEKAHYWTAAEFFKSVATRKVQSKDLEVKAPYFAAIEILPGGTAEMFVVPVVPGSYDVFCTIDDHREKGMEGKIVVAQ
ncbi:MAG: cupredoxin domain-containing protein [Alphaproteobacteria bacterium]